MFVILIILLSGENCFPGDTETQYRSQLACQCACQCACHCACQCAYNVLYYCGDFDKRDSCPKPVRTNAAIPTPISTPVHTPIPTPVLTVSQSTLLPTGTRPSLIPTESLPYYCFVTCKRQVLPKTWFRLILGLT
jgi:hypothetical protein